MSSLATLEKAVLELSAEERAHLIDQLLNSITPVDDSLREEWIRESNARIQAYREGKIEAIDGEEAIARIRHKLSE